MEPLVSARDQMARHGPVGAEVVPLTEARKVPQFRIAELTYRVWWSLNPGRIPYSQDVDPLIFGPSLLPHLSLIDVLDDGADYRWRLSGEKTNDAVGVSLRHWKLSKLEAEQADQVLFRELLDDVTRNCAPLFYVLRYNKIAGAMRRAYGVLLPLSDRADTRGPGDGSDRADTRGPRDGPTRAILGACATTTGL